MTVLTTVRVPAQEGPSFGVYGDYSVNMHVADFRQLPGVPNCCPRFEKGTGAGLTFGGLYELSLSSQFALQLRAGYRSLDGELIASEPTTVLHEGKPTAGEFEHRIDAAVSTIGLEPMLGIRTVGGLRVNIGVNAGMLLTKSYDQREQISSPDGAGTFLDSLGNDSRSRERNRSSGEIPQTSSFQMALLGGISYTLPLNARRTLFLSPEVIYSFGLTPVASNLKWNVHSLRVGVAVTFSPFEQEVGGPGRVDTFLVAPQGTVAATVAATGVEANGVELPSVRLTVEEFSSTLMIPILNYLFFDENSADIPGRYSRLQPRDVDTFNIDRVNTSEKLSTYHHLLNIIGRRLRDVPNARITLTGCNQDSREEKDNIQLSRRRAESVREYLKDVWGIAEGRIRIEARNLSAKAATTQTQDGEEENRRVEITSNVPGILSPIVISDTLRTVTPPSVRFRPAARTDAGVTSWQLVALQEGKILKRFEGNGPLPPMLVWMVNDETGTTPRYEGDIRYRLSVTDSAGVTGEVENSIPVEQMTIRRKRIERRDDKEIDRSSLILFDVRSADLSPAGSAIIPLIKTRIQPASRVMVTGYTDRLGDAAYNQQLAERRAATVAKALGVGNITSKGIGQADLYDNSLPEGRLYTRTVDLVIETPVNK